MTKQEAFEYLGLEPTESRAKVQMRYMELAAIYHPNGVDGGEFPLMHKINEAHDVLLGRPIGIKG